MGAGHWCNMKQLTSTLNHGARTSNRNLRKDIARVWVLFGSDDA